MTPNQIRAAGAIISPDPVNWIGPLSKLIGVDRRSVARWYKDPKRYPPPSDLKVTIASVLSTRCAAINALLAELAKP